MKISAYSATLLYRDLCKFKRNVLRKTDLSDNDNLLDLIRAELPCNIINSINFRNGIKVLRTLLDGVKNMPKYKPDVVIPKFCSVLNPMIDTLKPDVLFYVTQEQRQELEVLDARNKWVLLSQANKTDEEVFSKYEDYLEAQKNEEEFEDASGEFVIKSTVKEKKDTESALRRKLGDTSDEVDVESLLSRYHKPTEPNFDSPFAVLGQLQENLQKQSEEHPTEQEIDVKSLLKSNPDIDTWTPEQKLALLKCNPAVRKETDEEYMEQRVKGFDKYQQKDYPVKLDKKAKYVIMDMPIYAQTQPYLTASTLQKLGVVGQQVMGGWILENQKCVGIRNSADLDLEIANACMQLYKETGYTWYNTTYEAEWVTPGYRGLTWVWVVPHIWNLYFGNLTAFACQHAFKMFHSNGDKANLQAIRGELELKIKEYTAKYQSKLDRYNELTIHYANLVNKYSELLQPYEDELEEAQREASCSDVLTKISGYKKVRSVEKTMGEYQSKLDKYDAKYKKYRLRYNRLSKRLKEKAELMRAEAFAKYQESKK